MIFLVFCLSKLKIYKKNQKVESFSRIIKRFWEEIEDEKHEQNPINGVYIKQAFTLPPPLGLAYQKMVWLGLSL